MPGSGGRPTIPHVPALDGLRGVAVAGVLLFHAGHLPGGFLGVDLFFTLSGFLITSLLLVEREATGRVDLRRFWARRLRRLLPALLLVVVVAAALAPVVLRDGSLGAFRTQALATLGYVANWAEVARARDYWALFDEPLPLDHAWSLAIEEQFYVVWPLVVLLAARVATPRRAVRAVAVAGIAASLGAAWWVLRDGGGITRTYYGTDTRVASILVGAALATWTTGRVRGPGRAERWASAAGTLALAAVVASWAVVDGGERWLYGWGLSAHAALTAAVVAAAAGPAAGLLGRALSRPLVVRTGVLSYGLYLWHWPLYLLLDAERTGLDGWSLTALRLGASYAVAELSHRLVEAPIRSERVRLPRPAASTLGAMAVSAVVVVAVAWPRGPDALPPLPSTSTSTSAPRATVPGDPPTTAPPAIETVSVLGDSQALTLAENAPDELGIDIHNAANLGCGLSSRYIVLEGERVHRGRCDPILAQAFEEIAAVRPDVVVVLSGVWEASDHLVDGEDVVFGDPRWSVLLRDDIRPALVELSARNRVAVLTTPCLAAGGQRDDYVVRDLDARIAAYNDVLRVLAGELGLQVVELAELLCPDGEVVTELDGFTVRDDGVHYDVVGARIIWPWLLEELRRR
jgi:peptidoglycan/LPS O-acetylase OafA/YrhL